MNDEERKKQTEVAVWLLENVAHDVLRQANEDNEGALDPGLIALRIGLPVSPHYREVVRYALKRMDNSFQVEETASGWQIR